MWWKTDTDVQGFEPVAFEKLEEYERFLFHREVYKRIPPFRLTSTNELVNVANWQ